MPRTPDAPRYRSAAAGVGLSVGDLGESLDLAASICDLSGIMHASDGSLLRGQAPVPRDAAAYATLAGSIPSGVLILCDHASNHIPAEYAGLGLPPAQLERHIAWDIGAAEVAWRMAALLGAPAIGTAVSRLVIDCNRGADDPTLIMRLSDGAVVPGNRVITPAERAARIAAYYDPYHDAIAAQLDAFFAANVVPIIVSMHSFTDCWRGAQRPWHCAVLWDRDPRLAHVYLDGLRRDASLVVGDNEPYDGALNGDCLYRHGTSRGFAHVLIEIRQDLIADAAGQQAWAVRLSQIVSEAMADPNQRAALQTVHRYGSRAD